MGQDRGGRSTFSSCHVPSDILAVKVGLAVVVLVGAALVGVPAWNLRTAPVARAGDIMAVLFCASIGLALIGLSLYAWGLGGPRTWEWDADGIEFRGPRGRLHLRWADVERVRWKYHGVTLVGRNGRIVLPLAQLKPARRAEARDELLRILHADFGLPVPPPEGQWPPFPWKGFAVGLAALLWFFAAIPIAYFLALPILRRLVPLALDLFQDEPTVRTLAHLVVTMIWGCLLAPFLIWGGPRDWYDRRPA